MPDQMYEQMLQTVQHYWCWLCGRDDSYKHKPDWWHAPWLLERAHIVNKPRRLDRRAVVLLCSLCHRLEHGDVFPEIKGQSRPVYRENLLWAKRVFDRRHYDRRFLQSCTATLLERSAPPHKWYIDQYRARRGEYPHLVRRDHAGLTVHLLLTGGTACKLMPPDPRHWPAGHVFVASGRPDLYSAISCPACRKAAQGANLGL